MGRSRRTSRMLVLWVILGAVVLGTGLFASQVTQLPVVADAALTGVFASTTVWVFVGLVITWIGNSGRGGGFMRAASAALVMYLGAFLLSYSLMLAVYGDNPVVTDQIRQAIHYDVRTVALMGLGTAIMTNIAQSAFRWLTSTGLGIGLGVLAYEPTMAVALHEAFSDAVMSVQFSVAVVVVVVALVVLVVKRVVNPFVVIPVAMATTALLVKISLWLQVAPQGMLGLPGSL